MKCDCNCHKEKPNDIFNKGCCDCSFCASCFERIKIDCLDDHYKKCKKERNLKTFKDDYQEKMRIISGVLNKYKI